VFACDPPQPPTPTQERERNKHFGLIDIEVFRVGQHCRRVGNISGCVFFSARHFGSWRKGDTRGRPERPPPRSSRQSASALSLANGCLFLCTAAFARVHFCLAAFWTLSDVGRGQSGKGRVSPGADGQSGCVRRLQQVPAVCKGGNFSPFSRRA
jgi:hypothetical protein